MLCSRVPIGRVFFYFLILASSLLSKSTPKLSKDEDGDLWGSIAAPKISKRFIEQVVSIT
ncbi:hypothetical protein GLYMA_10G170350v4 [Glycine max]|nr:hypothetical protein GLYMA_10G170350v4 [Glycine max]KAH1138695.1 hypothetical protein GYH30_028262 [Glycine max]